MSAQCITISCYFCLLLLVLVLAIHLSFTGIVVSTSGIAGLQAAVDAPEKVRGVQLMNVSLRMLHTTKQAPWQRPLVSSFQRLLRETQVGVWLFNAVAKPQVTCTWHC